MDEEYCIQPAHWRFKYTKLGQDLPVYGKFKGLGQLFPKWVVPPPWGIASISGGSIAKIGDGSAKMGS